MSIIVRAFIFGVGLLGMGTGTVSFGTIIAMTDYSARFWQPLMNLSNLMNMFINAVANLERIFEMMDEPVTVDDLPGAKEMPEIKGDVHFRDVTFAYEPGINILEHLSFDVKAGQSVALVGPTGAGKTTITSLINRFYEIQSGTITYDGINVRDIQKDSLRRSLGVVLQDTHLFTGTVADNIRYGRLDATDEEVEAAARLAGADGFIRHLPDGYQTVLTSEGGSLSQGERQLLNIARAACANPPVLILDEATSSIDTRTEKLIEKGMDRLMAGRTVFVIAHRLSTVRNSKAIMVLEQGSIIERGDHEDLLAQHGRYYQLYTGQAELA